MIKDNIFKLEGIQNKGIIYSDKLVEMREDPVPKILAKIDAMNSEEIIQKLKEKNIPTHGNVIERKERLKKANGTLNRHFADQSE